MRESNRPSEKFFLRQLQKVRHRVNNPLRKWRFADEFRPDAIVVSDAATYHFLSVPGLIEFLKKCDVPFFTISQYNDENAYLSEHAYRKARAVFAKARSCFFVSRRNLAVAQRQLCYDFSQAFVVHNPPNLRDWSSVPFPSFERPHYCMVARLECAVKDKCLFYRRSANPYGGSGNGC